MQSENVVKLMCWMAGTLLNLVFILLDVRLAQGAPYAWQTFCWMAEIFGNEICGPRPLGLSCNAGAHQVSVVGQEPTWKWDSSSPLARSPDCVSVSQACGREDLSQPQVHVHTEDPSVRGSREHCVQLTSGNSGVDLFSSILESCRRISSCKASTSHPVTVLMHLEGKDLGNTMEFKDISFIANFTASAFYCLDFRLIKKNSEVLSVSYWVRCQATLMSTPRVTERVEK